MAESKLSESEIQQIVSLLREGKRLPESYRSIIFETKKELELVYADKDREEDILADTMSVPLQKVETLCSSKNDDSWSNMLIFGDNLRVLKSLLQMKRDDKIRTTAGLPGVKLVYIDPPFATKQEFRGSQEEKAYQDKIAGARFVEFLRKRLVFLRELLSEDGSMYVHVDQRKGHYIKAILDEVMAERNFVNEIIWKSTSAHTGTGEGRIRAFGSVHDMIFLYVKSESYEYNPQYVPLSEAYVKAFYRYVDKSGRRYRLSDLTAAGVRHGESGKPWRGVDPTVIGRHWAFSVSRLEELTKEGRICFPKKRRGVPSYKRYLDEMEGHLVQDVWTDIKPAGAQATERLDYPTQKPEKLLRHIVEASSSSGDIVLDCFAGSGTTLAVAEKLGRRWIGIDCGKLAIRTMQKRMLDIADSKDLRNPPKRYGKQSNPFTLYVEGGQ